MSMYSLSQFQSKNDRVLDDSELRRVAPSIFAESAYSGASSRYTFIPTSQVVAALRKEGWQPVKAAESRTRIEEKNGYQKHMIRFRHADSLANNAPLVLGDSHAEIVLVNGHDGSSSYQIHAGLYRLVCANGMVVADSTIEKVCTRHTGDIIGQVIEGTYSIIDAAPRAAEKVASWQALQLSAREREVFGAAALELKWEGETAPVDAARVVQPRRVADNQPNLWATFNTVQENLLRGGMRGRGATGKRTTTREVSGVSENVRLNKALWTLADEFAKLKRAA